MRARVDPISAHTIVPPRSFFPGWRPRGWRSLAFVGPGALIAVGYVDPGNWATDLAGGSRYGYALLWVVIAASVVAMLFQTASARLGIATGSDLAEASRELSPRAAWLMWGAAELAIIATDLAEVLGSGLALELIFGVPLLLGVTLTAFDVFLFLELGGARSRGLQRVVGTLVLVIAIGFAYQLALARPELSSVLAGVVPSARVARDPAMLYAAMGIIGATIMPHNLYLHSSLAKEHVAASDADKREAAKRARVDTLVSLGGAMLVNGALLVLAGALFHAGHLDDEGDLVQAHRLLAPLLGARVAPFVFAVSLLLAGQCATMTGTLAGQVVVTGFLRVRWPAWKRRLITRVLALAPAVAVIGVWGEAKSGALLVASQVILSLQLPFAVVPLLWLTGDRRRMGPLVSGRWTRAVGWACAAVIVVSNAALVTALFR